MISTPKESPDGPVSAGLIQVHIVSRDADVKQKSVGWFGSIAVHAVVLVIMYLLVAPADFGGVRFLLTIRQIDPSSQSLDLIRLSSDLTGDLSAKSNPLSASTPVDTSLPMLSPVSLTSAGDQSRQPISAGGEAGGGTVGGGPGGSFFGIEASGQEFAYVLDMSGSMRGERYRRATSELLRSVGELRQDQSFYVLLFSDSTAQMFSEHQSHPVPVPATAENRERLKHWLGQTFEGGGTYPRNAIKLALKMNASAIFMLSDGEFNDDQANQPKGLFQSTGDLFSMVSAFTSPAPIHAIAFENPNSCKNMKRLAEITGGQYRYEESRAEADSKSAFDAAMKLADRPDPTLFEDALVEIVARFPNTVSANEAREELTRFLFERAKSQRANGKLENALASIVEMVGVLPIGQVLSPEQQTFVEEIIPHAPADPKSQAEQSTVATALKELLVLPDGNRRDSLDEFNAVLQTVSADRLFEQGKVAESMRALQHIGSHFPNTKAGDRARARCQEFVGEWLEKSQGALSTADREATIEMLKAISSTFGRNQFGRDASDGLQGIALQMLMEARDAESNVEGPAKAELDNEIARLFGDDIYLQNAKRQLVLTEARARRSLRVAQRLDRTQGIVAATSAYRAVINQYPLTLAASQAGGRLEQAKVDEATDTDHLEAIAQEQREADFQRLLQAQ